MFLKCNFLPADEILKSKYKVCLGHVDGPGKFVPVGLVVDFFYRYLPVLTPGCMRKKKLFSKHCKINVSV